MLVTSKAFHYIADGLNMTGQLYLPANLKEPAPGVLVFPEALGIGDHSRQWAERIASELGYAVLACDLFGNGYQCSSIFEAMLKLKSFSESPQRMRAYTYETLEVFAKHPQVDESRIAAIGFCFGGTLSFELATRGAPLAAAIGFHSRLVLTPLPEGVQVKARILALIGAADPMIPSEQIASFQSQMNEAGADWQLHLFGGVLHSFTNPEADKRNLPEAQKYDEKATRSAWKQMASLLEDVF